MKYAYTIAPEVSGEEERYVVMRQPYPAGERQFLTNTGLHPERLWLPYKQVTKLLGWTKLVEFKSTKEAMLALSEAINATLHDPGQGESLPGVRDVLAADSTNDSGTNIGGPASS